jgi:hypothetical protein
LVIAAWQPSRASCRGGVRELYRFAGRRLGRAFVALRRAFLLPLQLLFFLGLFRAFAISPLQAIIWLAHRRTSLLIPSKVRGRGLVPIFQEVGTSV